MPFCLCILCVSSLPNAPFLLLLGHYPLCSAQHSRTAGQQDRALISTKQTRLVTSADREAIDSTARPSCTLPFAFRNRLEDLLSCEVVSRKREQQNAKSPANGRQSLALSLSVLICLHLSPFTASLLPPPRVWPPTTTLFACHRLMHPDNSISVLAFPRRPVVLSSCF